MTDPKVLIYLMRRDLRVSDNPVLHSLTTNKDHGFTHLLPIYVLAAQQLEVSGFIEGDAKCPYPEARTQVGGFWRCGPHRLKFTSESLWDLKESLEKLGSGLCIRVGMVGEVISQILEAGNINAVWLTGEEGVEEAREEREIRRACKNNGVDFKLWVDEKYLIDDRDGLVPTDPQELPDIYTTYRKSVEPLREQPRAVLATPEPNSLPPFPSSIPPQPGPFTIPQSLPELQAALMKPLNNEPLCRAPPVMPPNAKSAHPFLGGETYAQKRLGHLLSSGSMTNYLNTRNGLLGPDFSSKLSAYLALGCITARQIHAQMSAFEDGTNDSWTGVSGYGKGENPGTSHMRFELLWRDYMRLCTRKFGPKLFSLEGFKAGEQVGGRWAHPSRPRPGQSGAEVKEMLERFMNGTTGMGLIDASLRETYLTGYTSNRARQNVASFLAKHLSIDWRLGAEWYECLLVDYDLSSNWGNWQYVAGVGNDPRGQARIFNPVKQAFDYDPNAEYVKTWVPETRELTDPGECFQAWTVGEEKRRQVGLNGLEWVERPLKRIEFTVGRGKGNGRGRGSGGRGESGDKSRDGRRGYQAQPGTGQNPRYGGRGYGSSRGYFRGGQRGRGDGRDARMGMMDRDRASNPEQQQEV
ncbi:cryptochrome [Hyphodiscus hymeniophilus]|uniref:Cryptochrome DASH n=1 Tax=Hyphodiscus hymeniophilus TaxID=353542 RepID=A0A9P6VQ65_9HELO|nr:cryptochrome [Hyphodiscus hymeniophilus]